MLRKVIIYHDYDDVGFVHNFLSCLLLGSLDFNLLSFYYGRCNIGAKSLTFGGVQKTAKLQFLYNNPRNYGSIVYELQSLFWIVEPYLGWT